MSLFRYQIKIGRNLSMDFNGEIPKLRGKATYTRLSNKNRQVAIVLWRASPRFGYKYYIRVSNGHAYENSGLYSTKKEARDALKVFSAKEEVKRFESC